MDKTVCELFAGVGGFRCGLNYILSPDDYMRDEDWKTVWFNQWEPSEKKTQYAHGCYVYRFGDVKNLKGEYCTNINIEDVNKDDIPEFNLLVGGFPCQDYSVASTLSSSKGIEGKKGVLWWSIRDVLEAKEPPFILLENVDRLLKSPAKQRGRDFGIILSCLNEQGYTVEWRVINAAEYGWQQRRRRTFIFAYKNNTVFGNSIHGIFLQQNNGTEAALKIILDSGFFADQFKVMPISAENFSCGQLPNEIGDVSAHFQFNFENAGIMINGTIYTVKTSPLYNGQYLTLKDILENSDVDEKYFIPDSRLYYNSSKDTHSNEIEARLPLTSRHTWQYIKGAKKYLRQTANGHQYVYSEGAIPMIDASDKPARTMLTSEGSFNRSTHLVVDKNSGRIRLLTAEETERIQGFATEHTKYSCTPDNQVIEVPLNKRRFMMGNALVVNLVSMMEVTLSKIFANE